MDLDKTTLKAFKLYGIIMSNYGAITIAYEHRKYVNKIEPYLTSFFPDDKERIEEICKPCLNQELLGKTLNAIKEYKRIAPPEILELTKPKLKEAEDICKTYAFGVLGVNLENKD